MPFTKEQWERWKKENPDKWEERRKRLSEIHRGKILSNSHRKKIARSMKGRKLTEEHKKKIRDSIKRSFEKEISKGRLHVEIPELIKKYKVPKFRTSYGTVLLLVAFLALIIILDGRFFYGGLVVYQATEWENYTSVTIDRTAEFITKHIVFENYKPENCKEGIFVTDGENNITFDIKNPVYENGLCSEADIVFQNLIYKTCPKSCGISTCGECYSQEFENKTTWQQNCTINYCGESTDYDCESTTTIQTCDPNVKCQSYKEIINEIEGTFWLECIQNETEIIGNKTNIITGSALYGQRTTKTYYIYYGKKPEKGKPVPPSKEEISFDRDPQCDKCGKHKAPPLSDVNMSIVATFNGTIYNATFIDYYPKDWTVVDPNKGIVSDYNETYKKIEWYIGDVSEKVERWYIIQSPERTLPPTEYYFQSELNNIKSDWWQIIVADPARELFDRVGAPCSTTKDNIGQSCTPSTNLTGNNPTNATFEIFTLAAANNAGWITIYLENGRSTTSSNNADTGNATTNTSCSNPNTNFIVKNGYCLNTSTEWSCSWNNNTKNFNFSRTGTTSHMYSWNISYEILPCSPAAGLTWDFDEDNNESSAGWTTITIPEDWIEAWGVNESNPPRWWSNSTNDTSPVNPKSAIRHNINWTDEYGLSYYKFEWNATGASCSGGFSNVSEGSLSGTTQWNNITQTLPSACNNTVISWRQYANDTNNRWNWTDYQNYTVRPYGWLNVTLTDPSSTYQTPSNPKVVNRYSTFWINATVNCTGATNAVCGLVNGTARYNSSGTTANTNISTSSSATPFYTTNTQPQQCGSILYKDGTCKLNWTTNASGTWSTQWAVDVNFNSTNYSNEILMNNTSDAYIEIFDPAPRYSHQSQNDTLMENRTNNLSSNWSDNTSYLDMSWLETNETGSYYNYTDLLQRNYNYTEEGTGSGDDTAYWSTTISDHPESSEGTEFTTTQYLYISQMGGNYVNHSSSSGYYVFHRFNLAVQEDEENITRIRINWRGGSGYPGMTFGSPLYIYAKNYTINEYVEIYNTTTYTYPTLLSFDLNHSFDDLVAGSVMPGGLDIKVYCAKDMPSNSCWLATDYMDITVYYSRYYTSPKRLARDTQKWSNFTWLNDSITPGTTISWRTCANDTYTKQNCTPYMNFTFISNPPPQYNNLGQLDNEIIEDEVNYLWSNWSDSTDYLDWAWLATNETGSYYNYTNTTIQQETVDEVAYNNTSITSIPESSEGVAIADLTNITSDDSIYVNTSRTTMNGIWVSHQFNFSNIQNVDDIANMTIFWNGITDATAIGSGSFPLYIYNYVTTSYQFLNQTAPDYGNEINITGTVSSNIYKYIQNGKAKFKVYSVYNATPTAVVYLATDYVYLNITRGQNHTSPRNLRYNTTAKTNFTWNNTSIAAGTTVCWKIYANDSDNKQNVTSPEQCFNVISGNNPPQWSQNATSIASGSQYNPSNNYGFQINWTDPEGGMAAVSQGFIFTNLTGSNITYNKSSSPAVTNNTAGTYWINFTDRAAGTYFFQWKANDTSNAWNSSDTWIYVIAKNTSGVMRLWLNDTEDNKSYVQGETANFTAKLNISSKTIYLNSSYSGWVEQSDTDSDIYNYTVLNSMGDNYNLTAYWNGDTNYTSDSQTYFFNVTTNCLPPSSGSWVIQATDNIICQNKIIYLDGNLTIYGNLTFLENVTLKMNLTSNGMANITVYDGGNLTIRRQSNISSNNTNYRYGFEVKTGSKFELNSSEVHYAGWEDYVGSGPDISFNSSGLYINTTDALVYNSTLSFNAHGIVVSREINITDNRIFNNSYDGILFPQGSIGTPNISNNLIQNHSGFAAVYLGHKSMSPLDIVNCSAIISSNNISYSKYGVHFWGCGDATISSNRIYNISDSGIYGYTENDSVSNNYVTNVTNTGEFEVGSGMYFAAGNGGKGYNNITNNNVSNAYYGIYLITGNINNVTGNIANSTTFGIYSYNSDNGTIKNNNISSSNTYGIIMNRSDYNNIQNNILSSNGDGLVMYNSTGNNITDDNNISFNSRLGVVFIDSYPNINMTQVENNVNGKGIFAWSTSVHTITFSGSNLANAYVEARNVSAIPASYEYYEYNTSIPSFTTDANGWTTNFIVYQNRTNNDSTTTDFNDHTFFANKTGVGSGKNITTMNESKNITVNVTTHSPVVSNVFVDDDALPLNNISLYGGTTRNIRCNATISDEEGWWDVDVSNVTFFDDAYPWDSANNNNSHYSNSSCRLFGGSGESIYSECIIPVWYYANSTAWNCNMTVNDTFNNVSWGNDTNYIDPLLAVGVNTITEFGTLNQGQTSPNDINNSITNYGNVRIDLQLNGSNMSCTVAGNIFVGLEKYNCTHYNQDYNTYMSSLSETLVSENCTGFDLSKQNTSALSEKNTSWKIQIPSGVGGVCTGQIWFVAVSG